MKAVDLVKLLLLVAILVLNINIRTNLHQVQESYQIVLPVMDSIRQNAIDTLKKYENDTSHITTVKSAISILTKGQ